MISPNGFGHIIVDKDIVTKVFYSIFRGPSFWAIANSIVTTPVRVSVFPIQKLSKSCRNMGREDLHFKKYAQISTLNHHHFQFFKYRDWTTPLTAACNKFHHVEICHPPACSNEIKNKMGSLHWKSPKVWCGHFGPSKIHQFPWHEPSQATWKRNHESGSLLVGIPPA